MYFRNSVIIMMMLFSPLIIKANISITAGHFINNIDSLASTIASDAELILVKSLDVDTTGKAVTWNYVYASIDSLKEYHFSVDNNLVKYDSSTSLRVGIAILDSNWIDSDSALYLAEFTGGYEFRTLYPNSNIKASLYKPLCPPFNNYWVVQYINGDSSINITINALDGQVVSSVDHLKDRDYDPCSFTLFQNYPNPFNTSTIISYSILKSGFVSLKIYDMHGREIHSLVNKFQEAHPYSMNFDAKNLSSGIYFYQLRVGNDFVETKKMLLLR